MHQNDLESGNIQKENQFFMENRTRDLTKAACFS